MKVRQLIREMYANPANENPNMNEAWDLLKDKLPAGVTWAACSNFGKRKRKK